MAHLTDTIIEALGGLTAIADMTRAPVSTVNSWKSKITDSRLHHLQLAARDKGLEVDWSAMGAANGEGGMADHLRQDAGKPGPASSGMNEEISGGADGAQQVAA